MSRSKGAGPSRVLLAVCFVGRGAAHSLRSSVSTVGSSTVEARPCVCREAAARRAPNVVEPAGGVGGVATVDAAAAGVVMRSGAPPRPRRGVLVGMGGADRICQSTVAA